MVFVVADNKDRRSRTKASPASDSTLSTSIAPWPRDANNLREVLKFSAQMLFELRTSKLSPHRYYELSFDELKRLEMFFQDKKRHGVPFIDLYDIVQHAANILLRL